MKVSMENVNFFRLFHLGSPVTGLVMKITSPKGIRTLTVSGYSYDLHEDLCSYEKDKALRITPGLYHVIGIGYVSERIVWNHYLLMADTEEILPVGEYLDQPDSSWILQAIPIIKKVMSGTSVDPIELTKTKFGVK